MKSLMCKIAKEIIEQRKKEQDKQKLENERQ